MVVAFKHVKNEKTLHTKKAIHTRYPCYDAIFDRSEPITGFLVVAPIAALDDQQVEEDHKADGITDEFAGGMLHECDHPRTHL